MKSLKTIAISISKIIALLAILFVGYCVYLQKTESAKLHPTATKEVVEGIYAIKDAATPVNLYLIKSADGYIAIDAGANLSNVQQGLDLLKIAPEKVTAIFLTHTDMDHVGGIQLFKNAKVYISSAEEQMINGQTARALGSLMNSLNSTYQKIGNNEIIDVSDLEVKGILTPGHTPGHMCYLVDEKYLFTGDTLSLKNGKAELFSEIFDMDQKEEAESIKQLALLPNIKYMFTAHYGYTNNFKKAMHHWMSK